MSLFANQSDDMLLVAEDMSDEIQQSFPYSNASQPDADWRTMSKEWLKMPLDNAINTGGVDAKRKFL